MSTYRRLLSCALLLPCFLTGCHLIPESGPRRDTRSGFSVVVDGPGRPAGAGVAADIGAFAQRREFVRQPSKPGPAVDPVTHEPRPPTPERYLSGDIVLEVTVLPAEHRVTAYLHGLDTGRNRKTIEGFYRAFKREYADRYGGAGHLSETAYAQE